LKKLAFVVDKRSEKMIGYRKKKRNNVRLGRINK
jgi:hypothetical protein